MLLTHICITTTSAQQSELLKGTVIGTEKSVDYNNGNASTTVNTRYDAFDGNLDTYFASYNRSKTWCGLDLGTKHVITRVGWSPRNDGLGPQRVVLALFEGANSPDFIDAVPLYFVDEQGTIGTISYADVNVSRGFRYVRYVGPNNARCNIAEVQFYGYEAEGDDSQFYQPTNLPVVVFHTVDNVDPYDKENDIVSTISIISNDGKKILTQPGTTRLRGNASMQFEKKPYRIKFDKKQNVLDAPAKAKKWTLINNYGDKTLMRNIVAFELSRRLGMAYTPFCTPVDVIANGEYKGCYQLCDQIEVNPGRVEVDEMTKDDISGEALTGGYLIEVDAYAYEEVSWFNSNRGNPVTIKSPADDEITPEQSAYIRQTFNNMEEKVFANTYQDPTNGYRSLLDLNSFLQHFIVGEFSGNTDTYWSTYMYKKRNDPKLYVGPVWDFDIAFDNDNRTYPINNKSTYVYRNGGSHAGNMHQLVERVAINDGTANSELKAMWATMRNTGKFTAESLTAFIDETAAQLDESQRLNFMRWNILNTKVHQNPVARGSYAAEVNYLKEYVTERIEWFDKKLKYEPTGINQLTTPSATPHTYNMMGQRVTDNTNGIVIRNGKKFLQK